MLFKKTKNSETAKVVIGFNHTEAEFQNNIQRVPLFAPFQGSLWMLL